VKLTWRFVLVIAALLASVAVTATFGLRAPDGDAKGSARLQPE
jgi:hypothetical protein